MRWLSLLLQRLWAVRERVLVRAMVPDDVARLFHPDEQALAQHWLVQQELGDMYVAVAEIRGVPVGRRCLNFRWHAGARACYGFAATVRENWRSRGVGALIDRHSEMVARSRGFHAIRTAVATGNARGLVWHQALGYRKIGERVVGWQEPDGAHETGCWILERRWADDGPQF